MRGILFIGGLGPTPGQLESLLGSGDLVCAADSGLDACIAASIQPDGIVGDMDSLSSPALLDRFSSDTIERSPVDKDETDTELGVFWLESRGADEIILIGGGEGRLDHTLALRALFGRDNSILLWYTAREEIRPVSGKTLLRGCRGDRFSFFPVGSGPWKVRSSGLVWELDKLDWAHDSVSLSNRLENELAEVSVDCGRILIIRPLNDALLQIHGRKE